MTAAARPTPAPTWWEALSSEPARRDLRPLDPRASDVAVSLRVGDLPMATVPDGVTLRFGGPASELVLNDARPSQRLVVTERIDRLVIGGELGEVRCEQLVARLEGRVERLVIAAAGTATMPMRLQMSVGDLLDVDEVVVENGSIVGDFSDRLLTVAGRAHLGAGKYQTVRAVSGPTTPTITWEPNVVIADLDVDRGVVLTLAGQNEIKVGTAQGSVELGDDAQMTLHGVRRFLRASGQWGRVVIPKDTLVSDLELEGPILHVFTGAAVVRFGGQ